MDRIDRRAALAFLAGAAALPLTGAAAPQPPTMWRDPGCGCCSGWGKKVEAALGVRLRIVDGPDMPALKRARGVPSDLQSCHTALIGGLVFEGHVPPEDVKRLLASRPAGIRGLAVPGMPMGSAGMEMGAHTERYDVIAFGDRGARRLFSRHG
jgi:hypothetical protein